MTDDNDPQAAIARTWRLRGLIALCVGTPLYLIALVPVLMALLATLMSAGGGGTWGLLALLSNIAYPVVCVGALIAGWVCFGMKKHRAAFWLALAPLFSLALAVLCLQAMFASR